MFNLFLLFWYTFCILCILITAYPTSEDVFVQGTLAEEVIPQQEGRFVCTFNILLVVFSSMHLYTHTHKCLTFH